MPGEKWETNVVSFPVFRRKPPSFSGEVVGVMSMREATSSDWARCSTEHPVREALVLFSSDRGGNEVEDDYKKTGIRASVLECPLYWGGKLALLLLAFVAFVHSLDDGFGQIERGVGKKHVVSLF